MKTPNQQRRDARWRGNALWLVLAAALCPTARAGIKKKTPPAPSALDQYIQESLRSTSRAEPVASPGSLWVADAQWSNLTRDRRAVAVDDMVTILVVERASAVSKGTTKATRASSTKNSITALAGPTRATGLWANLANVSGNSALDGEASTTRDTTLTATLTARVTHVLPNGYLVVEGSKDVQINSERQTVTVRGVVRPSDLSPANQVRSDSLGQMEVRLNGKGIVGDAVRRPWILYRVLLGLLPF